MVKTTRAKRYVLLNESEITCIKKNKFNVKTKSDLISKLNTKINQLNSELNLIIDSEALEVWRELAVKRYWNVFLKLSEAFKALSVEQRRIYLDMIMRKGKGKHAKYWLKRISFEDFEKEVASKRSKQIYYSKRIFKPENVLRGFKVKKDEEALLRFYKTGYMPTKEEKAVSVDKIPSYMKDREIINEKSVRISKKKDKEAVNKIRDKLWDEGNKMLKPLGRKITQIQFTLLH